MDIVYYNKTAPVIHLATWISYGLVNKIKLIGLTFKQKIHFVFTQLLKCHSELLLF